MLKLHAAWLRVTCTMLLGAVCLSAAPMRTAHAADPGDPCEPERREARRRPGVTDEGAGEPPPCDLTRLPLPQTSELLPPEVTPERWRIVESLGYADNRLDPYAGNNPLKGDRPSFGRDGFLNLAAASSSQVELRRVPNAMLAGTSDEVFVSESASFDAVIYRGDTVFRPPEYQVRFAPVVNYSRTYVEGGSAGQATFAVQALFFEKHLRDVTTRYDFDSLRIGIQPLTSDFRGYLMLDQPAGIRLFGTRGNNLYQYSLGWFRPLAKNSARLNDIGTPPPHDDLFVATLYKQDFLWPGFTSAVTLLHDRNRNGGGQSDVTYAGVSGDGHLARLNFNGAAYYATGNASAADPLRNAARVRAFFAASELSLDLDWTRVRLSALLASGDGNLNDNRATGFTGLNSSPLFAGADSSFFFHQRLPLSGGIDLKQRDRLFDDLRATSGNSPPSFAGPGLRLLGIGADFDVTPRLRISLDANHLWFDDTTALSALIERPPIARDIGWDLSLNAFYRPFATQNVILRFAAAALQPGRGYRDLYGKGEPYSCFVNLIVAY